MIQLILMNTIYSTESIHQEFLAETDDADPRINLIVKKT